MTEENKVPQETQLEIKEEEIVEIPFDYRSFQPLVENAIRAINNVKSTVEGHIAYEKYISEISELCNSLKRIQSEVKQLHELDAVLASTKFTNKESVNAKIRKRVVEELTQHFKFVKISEEEVVEAEDIVVLDTPRAQVSTQPVVEKLDNSLPTRNLSSAVEQERLRREARAEALQERGQSPANFYEQAFNQDNAPVNMEIDGVDTDGLTPEEIAQFQGKATVDVDPRVDMLKTKIVPKRLTSGPVEMRGKNKGISRRD